MSHPPVGLLSPDAVPAAATTLTRAFAGDPFFAHVFPDPAAGDDPIRWYLEATARASIALGGAYATLDVPVGVALWIPTSGEIDPKTARASGLDRRAEVFGPEAEARFRALGAGFGELHGRNVPIPHRYLTILGVDPGQQGRGVGGAVLAPGLAAADRAGVPCYTETTRARNVPFYERHGFVVLQSGTIESVPYWTFRREPSPPGAPRTPQESEG